MKDRIKYDSETGVFTWLINTGKVKPGMLAGTTGKNGYVYICLSRKLWLAHRLAWLYEFGVLPGHDIDHINGDRKDNRICNLREATRSENLQNHSGASGAYRSGKVRRFKSVIRVNNKQFHLGYFDTEAEARDAYAAAKLNLHTFNDRFIAGRTLR
jgi:hypothetical protein